MSKIVRDKFNKEHQMPTTQVMGTISPAIATKINQMVISGDTSEAKIIVDNINTILKTQITDINADQFPEPFVSETKMNVDYSKPTGLFFLVTSGEANVKIEGKEFQLHERKIVFINERIPYNILSPTNSRLIMLSARFTWDKDIHA
tara:strand:+ start:2766 stop:3206 length:441 start_codon:yes stop_codon:yes gene_type:complete